MFLRFLEEPASNLAWLSQGGRETLFSYGVDADYLLYRSRGRSAVGPAVRDVVPSSHVELLQSMPISLTVGDAIFVHAGLRPDVLFEKQTDQDLMWIREPFLSKGAPAPLLVIHGHTPVMEPVFANRRIGIDTAAFATGRLTVLRMAGGRPWLMTVTA
jgi:serine/threonine protein phosphatase 1